MTEDTNQIATANYLAKSYKPCRISAPLSEWRDLYYACPFFSVHVDAMFNMYMSPGK